MKMHKKLKDIKAKKSLLASQPKPNTHHNEQFYKTTHKLTTQQTSLHLCRPHDLFLLHLLSHINVIAAIKKKKQRKTVITFMSLLMLRTKAVIMILC